MCKFACARAANTRVSHAQVARICHANIRACSSDHLRFKRTQLTHVSLTRRAATMAPLTAPRNSRRSTSGGPSPKCRRKSQAEKEQTGFPLEASGERATSGQRSIPKWKLHQFARNLQMPAASDAGASAAKVSEAGAAAAAEKPAASDAEASIVKVSEAGAAAAAEKPAASDAEASIVKVSDAGVAAAAEKTAVSGAGASIVKVSDAGAAAAAEKTAASGAGASVVRAPDAGAATAAEKTAASGAGASVVRAPDAGAAAGAEISAELRPPGEKGAQIAATLCRGEYKLKWMQYVRSMTPATNRVNYAEKVPESLALKLVDAQSKKHWFLIWLENNQKWSEVVATEEFRRSMTNSEETIEAWLTEAQWEDLYKSKLVASEIKKKQGVGAAGLTWKPDPNVPHLVEAMLYRGTVSHTFKKELAQVTSQSIKFRAQADPLAAQVLAEHLVSTHSSGARGSSPARAIAPPSPDALSARTAARLDNEQKAKIKKERQEREKLEKQEKKKAEAAAWRASPPGLARKWLDGAAKDVNSLNTTKLRLVDSDLAPGLKAEWQNQLNAHGEELVKLRAQMEAVCGGEAAAHDLFEKGKWVVDAFKKDLKDLNAVLTSRASRAKSARQQ